MALRQFGGDQHVSRFSDLSIITCDYGLQDIDIVIVDRTLVFGRNASRLLTILLVVGMIISGLLQCLKSEGLVRTHASLLIYWFQILLILAFRLTY